MLKSIENYFALVQTDEAAILASQKIPDMASMISAAGLDRLLYVVGQRMGSHHVHGTWPNLWLFFLEERDGKIILRDHDSETHVNQYVSVMFFVLDAMTAFISYVAKEGDGRTAFIDLVSSVRAEIYALNLEVVGNDFDVIDKA